MNKTRYCQFQGHQENNTTYICTYKDCKLEQKWVCVDCCVQQIHNHGQPNQNHLLKQQQFLDFIKKQSKPIYSHKQDDRKLIQIQIKELKYFNQSTQFLIQMLEEDLATIEKNYDLEQIKEIIKITKDNPFCQRINKLRKQQILIIIIKNINTIYHKKYQNNLIKSIKISQNQQKIILRNKMFKQNRKLSQIIKLFNIMPNWFMKAISNINKNQIY